MTAFWVQLSQRGRSPNSDLRKIAYYAAHEIEVGQMKKHSKWELAAMAMLAAVAGITGESASQPLAPPQLPVGVTETVTEAGESAKPSIPQTALTVPLSSSSPITLRHIYLSILNPDPETVDDEEHISKTLDQMNESDKQEPKIYGG